MMHRREHRPLPGKLHHRLGRMDVHVHLPERQVNVEHTPRKFPLHLPVGISLLQRGGQQRGLDEPPAAEKRLHGPGPTPRQRLCDKSPDRHTLAAVHTDQTLGELPPPGGVNGGDQLAVPRRVELLLPVPDVLDGHVRTAQSHLLEQGAHSGRLRAVALHELLPGGRVEKEVPDQKRGPLRTPGGLHRPGHAPLQGEGRPHVRPLLPGEGLQAADGGNRRQSLPPKAQRADCGQVPGIPELAGGMAEKGGGKLLRRDAAPVVRHPDKGHAPPLNLHHHRRRTGVHGVFHQLLDHTCRTLHHLTGGNQVRHMGRELFDMGHGLNLLSGFTSQAPYRPIHPG